MALRNRNGIWHYRFKLDGKSYAESTGLVATKRNESAAQDLETDHRRALKEGRTPERRVLVRQFIDAAEDFLGWAESEYREHPNSYKRLVTSFASLKLFFADTPTSRINAGA